MELFDDRELKDDGSNLKPGHINFIYVGIGEARQKGTIWMTKNGTYVQTSDIDYLETWELFDV